MHIMYSVTPFSHYPCNLFQMSFSHLPRRDLDSDCDLAVADSNGGERSYAATARMFKLRRNLDQLDRFHRQKEHDVLKVRSGHHGNLQTSGVDMSLQTPSRSVVFNQWSLRGFNANNVPH